MSAANGRPAFRQWAALPLRVIVGDGFIAHGYAKVMNGPDHFAASLHAPGVPAPQALAYLASLVTLVLGGSGPFALDRVRARNNAARTRQH